MNCPFLHTYMNIYYKIIPDKNYFIKDNDKHLFIDNDDMISILNTEVKNMEYIDIFSSLSIEDYYKTDIHWKQESLGEVVNALGEKMHFTNSFKDTYTKKSFTPPFIASIIDKLHYLLIQMYSPI